MKHITVLKKSSLRDTCSHKGCGECQTSCQSACKTSCTVGNQKCEMKTNKKIGAGHLFLFVYIFWRYYGENT